MLGRIMGTNVSLFDYDLPDRYIAQRPVEPRDHARLIVLDRATGAVAHKRFFAIVDELRAGDVLVFNRSKVFKARLQKDGVEVLVLRIRDGEIDALIRPGRKFAVTHKLTIGDFVVAAKGADGVCTLTTGMSTDAMLAFCDAHGSVPTPPYVTQGVDETHYQTVYAKEVGSVAAPTAGLHFTEALLAKLRAKGVQIEEVVLHVGIGTFRPMYTDTLEEHSMHSEWVSIDAGTASRITTAKAEGRHVIAVGTTTTRVLEGIAAVHGGLIAYEGEVNMFITSGFSFCIVDALVTNFHLPKSTLLVLVSAFAGRERVLAAYEEAKREDYRFFSFGDAMFVR